MISATIFHDGKPMAILKIGPGRKETDLRVVCADFFAENDIHTPCGRMNSVDFTWPSAPDIYARDALAILAAGLDRLYGTRSNVITLSSEINSEENIKESLNILAEREAAPVDSTKSDADLRPASQIPATRFSGRLVREALERRERDLDEREKQLEKDIENFRKSQQATE